MYKILLASMIVVLTGVVQLFAGEEARDALSVIHSRKSVRAFTDQPVSGEQVETLLRAAMAAPSGMDQRTWRFVVVTEQATKEKLAEKSTYAKMTPSAPVAIVICGDTEKDRIGIWYLDAAMAAENLLLAAEAMGLGAVYTAVYPSEKHMNDVAEILGLPKTIRPLVLIPIGYPQGKEKPKDKWNPALVHWERWGGSAPVSPAKQ